MDAEVTGEATGSGSVPAGQDELLLRFVNTRAIVGTPERLLNAETARRWLAEAGLIAPGTFVSEADAVALRELRAALVALLKSHVGADDPGEVRLAEDALGRAALDHPLAPRIGVRRAALAPAQDGVAGAAGAILGAAAAVAFDEREWARYKACKNPICYLGFRDNSRNGSAVYCSHNCSSQVSMRAYRQRKSIGSATDCHHS
jgi:predicted RNA-binding Zn ribbon-like protein